MKVFGFLYVLLLCLLWLIYLTLTLTLCLFVCFFFFNFSLHRTEPNCDNRYRKRSDLETHCERRGHTLPQFFTCGVCGKVYMDERIMRAHAEARHPGNTGAAPAQRAADDVPSVDEFEINFADLDIGRELGSGAFGRVVLATYVSLSNPIGFFALFLLLFDFDLILI